MKELVILSGKGGTGKTTVAASFAHLAESKVMVDADVDAANLELVLSPQVKEKHEFRGGKVAIIEPARCSACGRCAEVCLGNALFFYGREMTAEQLLATILEDRAFYRSTGGGVTLSGGEPLLQAEFCAELLGMAKSEGLHTAVDTCGMVPWEAFSKVLPVTDLFLYDIKQMDPALHRRDTGADNDLILENLRRLCECEAATEIRIPLVPGINDDDRFIDAAGALLSGLGRIRGVKVLPYNPLARSKYAAVGKEDAMPQVAPPSDEELRRVAGRLRSFGLNALSGRD